MHIAFFLQCRLDWLPPHCWTIYLQCCWIHQCHHDGSEYGKHNLVTPYAWVPYIGQYMTNVHPVICIMCAHALFKLLKICKMNPPAAAVWSCGIILWGKCLEWKYFKYGWEWAWIEWIIIALWLELLQAPWLCGCPVSTGVHQDWCLGADLAVQDKDSCVAGPTEGREEGRIFKLQYCHHAKIINLIAWVSLWFYLSNSEHATILCRILIIGSMCCLSCPRSCAPNSGQLNLLILMSMAILL